MVLVAGARSWTRSRRRSNAPQSKQYQRIRREQERPGTHRTGQGKNRRLHRRLRHQSGERRDASRSGSPTTCSRATAPARSWPCRRTTSATSNSRSKFNLPDRAGRASRPTGKGLAAASSDEGIGINSRVRDFLNGLPTAEAKAENHRLARSKRPRQKDDQLQTARLALQPAALLGRAIPDRLEKDANGNLITRRCPNPRCPCCRPTLDGLQTDAPTANRRSRARKDWVNLPDGSMRETNTMPQWAGSCWYYLRYLDPQNRRTLRRPRGGAILDGHVAISRSAINAHADTRRGSVRRRHRARRAAPALRALLAQGPVRPRLRLHARAVFQAGEPGTHPRRRRPEDVQVPRQRRQPRRHPRTNTAPTRFASTKCSWARSKW